MDHNSSATMRESINRVRDVVRVSKLSDLPVRVTRIAHSLGVDIVEPADITVDGYVGTTQDGKLAIRYRRFNSPARNRFTIAHEIGHILLSKLSGCPLHEQKMRRGSNIEEIMANRIAAEILMPEQVLKEYLKSHEPTWNNVQFLRRAFDVSAFALLRRITEVTGIAAMFARFELRGHSNRLERFLCDCTTDPLLLLESPLNEIIRRCIESRSRNATIAVFVGETRFAFPFECRMAGHHKNQFDWAYGWIGI